MDQSILQEEQIYTEALKINSARERIEFVRQRCGTRRELCQRILRLIEIRDRTGDVLKVTTDGLVDRDHVEDDTIRVGAEFGPYKLLQPIGSGGMGVVYMAEQSTPVRRKVAIKIIKLGMDSRNVLARFDVERQALAMMDHPNITRIYDAGQTESGRPYFVMELVTGISITKYCDRNQLSLRQRLELFHKVCNGVQHAHQKGIIHRDLKPSNIMVTHCDGIPVPKIIDFGIAKATDKPLTDKTLFTSYGNMIGTPEYMSPEQAEMSDLDIDTRSDVYALGVLLYELLTSTTPFYQWKKKGLHKYCEAVCNREPELASTRIHGLSVTSEEISRNRGTDSRSLNRLLRGDIDWILAKCLARHRDDRYQTAADLARDIQRHLEGQPIEAAGPNLSYRFRKFAGKHYAAISVAAMLLLSLVGATIVSTDYAIRANQAENEANLLRKKAEDERDRAVRAENRLAELNEQIGNEAATSAASLRYIKQFPESKFSFQLPPQQREFEFDVSDNGNPLLPPDSASPPVPLKFVSAEKGPADPETGSRVKEHKNRVYRIAIGNSGDMSVTAEEDGGSVSPNRGHPQPRYQSVVMIQDDDCATRTHEFLSMVAKEQQRLLGEDHRVLANTLCQMGEVAIQNEDWVCAEKSLRQCLKIMKKNGLRDPRAARMELLLGKSMLNQDDQQKIAEAVEALKRAFRKMGDLSEVSTELRGLVEDLKLDLARLDIPVAEILHEIHASWRPALQNAIQRTRRGEPHQ